MQKILVILFVFVAITQLKAQKMYEQQFSNCPLKFILEDTEYFINYKTGDSLMVQDFISGFEDKDKDKLLGVIMMQVMVDTANNVCCVSYTNKSNIRDKKLDVLGKLSTMEGWERLPNSDPKENICALVSIIFNKKEITVIRTGYNRNKGRNIMYSTIYKRKVIEPEKKQK